MKKFVGVSNKVPCFMVSKVSDLLPLKNNGH